MLDYSRVDNHVRVCGRHEEYDDSASVWILKVPYCIATDSPKRL